MARQALHGAALDLARDRPAAVKISMVMVRMVPTSPGTMFSGRRAGRVFVSGQWVRISKAARRPGIGMDVAIVLGARSEDQLAESRRHGGAGPPTGIGRIGGDQQAPDDRRGAPRASKFAGYLDGRTARSRKASSRSKLRLVCSPDA